MWYFLLKFYLFQELDNPTLLALEEECNAVEDDKKKKETTTHKALETLESELKKITEKVKRRNEKLEELQEAAFTNKEQMEYQNKTSLDLKKQNEELKAENKTLSNDLAWSRERIAAASCWRS